MTEESLKQANLTLTEIKRSEKKVESLKGLINSKEVVTLESADCVCVVPKRYVADWLNQKLTSEIAHLSYLKSIFETF